MLYHKLKNKRELNVPRRKKNVVHIIEDKEKFSYTQ